MKKIVLWNQFRKFSGFIRGKKTILVGGCFDIFHFGHLIFLEKAKREGDFLVVALESDKFIKKRKNRIPVHNQMQRAEILAALEIVDYVVCLPFLSTDSDYSDFVKAIKPFLVAVSENDKNLNKKIKQAQEIGALLKVVTPYIIPFASSKIHDYESFFSN